MLAILSIHTVMLIFLLGATRVLFAKTNHHGTPQRVTWIGGIASACLVEAFPVKPVADLTNIGILAAWLVGGIAIYFLLGRKHSLINPDSLRHVKRVVLPPVETQDFPWSTAEIREHATEPRQSVTGRLTEDLAKR